MSFKIYYTINIKKVTLVSFLNYETYLYSSSIVSLYSMLIVVPDPYTILIPKIYKSILVKILPNTEFNWMGLAVYNIT